MKTMMAIFMSASIAIGANTCVEWFKKGKLNPESKSCFMECVTLHTGMDSFDCPMQCHELCKFSKRVWIYFGNGMFSSHHEARKSADSLRERLNSLISSHYPDLAPLIANTSLASVAYNNDEGLFLQLLEVFTQKMGAEAQHFLRWLSDLSSAPGWFREAATKIAFSVGDISEVNDRDLQDHLVQYSSHLKNGDAVLIVPHSQGNMYAAAAYQQLFNKYGFMMAVAINRVAVPVSDDGTVNMHYSNLYSDGVLKLIPRSEPANVKNQPTGIFDHEFIRHYLNGNNSGPKILITTACLVSQFRVLPPNISSILGQDVHQSCKDVPPDDIAPGSDPWED